MIESQPRIPVSPGSRWMKSYASVPSALWLASTRFRRSRAAKCQSSPAEIISANSA